MSTRALAVFVEDGKEFAVMYVHGDGYPEEFGKELKDFLKGMKIVNGYGRGPERQANGMGCLAAQVVAHFKKDVGRFYLEAPQTRDIGEEYIYTVTGKEGQEPRVKVTKV